MTSTDETTAPTAPPSTRAPREDRAGLVWGTVLGAVILVVALVVALGGGTVPAAGDARAVVSAGGTQTVAVTLAGMRITPSVIEVPSGTRLVLDVTNTDAMRHDLVLATGQQTPLLAAGGSAHLDVGPVTASVEGWCSVPGHRAAGMTLSIVVTGAAATTGATGHDMAAMPPGPRPRSRRPSTSRPLRGRTGDRTTRLCGRLPAPPSIV